MEKRYQVFVSSTFADLKEERRRVIQTLMEMDCIPAGMELFPAADEEQWAFIRRVIDDCDYYLLIIGGRYGSTTPDGVSYTEKEYDYAVSKGIKVLALLHDKPDEIPVGKSELDPALRARLEAFRQRASKGRLVRFWNRAEDLPGLVALSLAKTIKTYPAVGWVRADAVANEDLLTQLNQLRQDNDLLRASLAEVRPEPVQRVEGLAGLDEVFVVHGHSSSRDGRLEWTSRVSWKEIFAYVSPYLVKYPNETTVKLMLCDSLVKRERRGGYDHKLDDQDFQTIGIQLKALGLTKVQYLKATDGSMGLFWSLTPQGDQLMIQLRTVPSSKA
jgi:hypothetical protein